MGRGLALQSEQDFCGETDQTSQKPFVFSEDTMNLRINIKRYELELVISRQASGLQEVLVSRTRFPCTVVAAY
jgi:hypothetical protein